MLDDLHCRGAIEITNDNIIEELAPLIGELRTKDKCNLKFIQVVVPNIGYILTLDDKDGRCSICEEGISEQFVELVSRGFGMDRIFEQTREDVEEELPQPVLRRKISHKTPRGNTRGSYLR